MERHFDPGALTSWLRERPVPPGFARQQYSVRGSQRWRPLLEDADAPEALEALTRVEQVASEAGLDRRALFGLAEQADWEALHLGILIWGTGDARNLARTVQQFSEADAHARASICEAAREDTSSAWGLWWPRDRHSAISTLGVPMGTKLLYFAGFEHASSPRPLIYDQRVHRSLSAFNYDIVHPQGEPGRLVTWAGEYGPYLQLGEATGGGLGLASDDVERALFEANGELDWRP